MEMRSFNESFALPVSAANVVNDATRAYTHGILFPCANDMSDPHIEDLLQTLLAGELTLADAQQQLEQQLRQPVTAHLADTQLDLERSRRCGYPEVIYAEGKTPATLVELFARLRDAGQDALATRVSDEQIRVLHERFDDIIINRLSRTVRWGAQRPPQGRVMVVTAGTSDRPVAEEALETLRWMNTGCELIVDVGVAGPRRLLAELPRLEGADAIVVAAGMEGALPSVVGGWVDCPIIAVPTSVGYGAAFGGVAALLGMLNSCAANVCVVNINAGFKAGYMAGLIARRRHAEQT
jgi:pyridinium-3,5-biscarboxylic acid mononucleotide synthase